MQSLEFEKNYVTCIYCEHFEPLYTGEDILLLIENGLCHKLSVKRPGGAAVCDDFMLMQGLHTCKDYPNKK